MQKSFRIVLVAALIGAGLWGWWMLFPGPERILRSRLKELARTVSFDAKEGTLAKAYHAQKLTEFFTADVEFSIDLREYPARTLNGRDELMRVAMWLRTRFREMRIEFVDINLSFGPDKQTATANLTCKAFFPGERDFSPQEFNFLWKKVDGKWLIYRVETVRTLSQNASPARPALELP
jgi:hypothetical protein